MMCRRWSVTSTTDRSHDIIRDRSSFPYTEADGRARVDYASGQDPLVRFAVVVEREAVGGIGIDPQPDVFRRSVEIGYRHGEEYWGRGIMSEAVPAVTGYASRQLHVCRVFAAVFDPNPGSVRVLDRAGYVFEGRHRRSVSRHGETRDQFLYAYVVGDQGWLRTRDFNPRPRSRRLLPRERRSGGR